MNNIMKKVIKLAFVAAFVAVAGYGVYANQTSDAMSDLALANVEALANSREGTGNGLIYLKGEQGTGGCINCPESSDTSCNC